MCVCVFVSERERESGYFGDGIGEGPVALLTGANDHCVHLQHLLLKREREREREKERSDKMYTKREREREREDLSPPYLSVDADDDSFGNDLLVLHARKHLHLQRRKRERETNRERERERKREGERD